MWSGYSYIYDVFYVKTAVITVGDIMEHFENNFYFLYEAVSLQKFVKKNFKNPLWRNLFRNMAFIFMYDK